MTNPTHTHLRYIFDPLNMQRGVFDVLGAELAGRVKRKGFARALREIHCVAEVVYEEGVFGAGQGRRSEPVGTVVSGVEKAPLAGVFGVLACRNFEMPGGLGAY